MPPREPMNRAEDLAASVAMRDLASACLLVGSRVDPSGNVCI